MKGKWRIVEMPDYTADFPDMLEPAYILFDGAGGGDFAFGCVTGAINGTGTTNTVAFSWTGADENDKLRATAGLNSSQTGRSKGRSASMAAMTPTSARAPGGLLQQPANDLACWRQANAILPQGANGSSFGSIGVCCAGYCVS